MSAFEVTEQFSPHDSVYLQGDSSALLSFVRLVEAAIESADHLVKAAVGAAQVAALCVTNASVLQELRQPGTAVPRSGYSPSQFAELLSSGSLPTRGFASGLLQMLLMQSTPRETVHFDRDGSTLWVIGTEYGLRRVAAAVRDAVATGQAEAELSDCTQEYYILRVTTRTA